MIKILFICHGNICRSPMAEFILKELIHRAQIKDSFFISSAATSTEELGNPVYPPACKKLAEHGIDCAGKRARLAKVEDYSSYDLIIGMDRENLSEMRRIFGDDVKGKFRILLQYDGRPGDVIADPWYTRDFDSAWRDIYAGCFGLLRELCPVVELDFSRCTDRSGLYAELRRKMLWQDWYGESLDALHDILTGLPYLGKDFRITMPSPSAPESCRDYAEKIAGEFASAIPTQTI